MATFDGCITFLNCNANVSTLKSRNGREMNAHPVFLLRSSLNVILFNFYRRKQDNQIGLKRRIVELIVMSFLCLPVWDLSCFVVSDGEG